MILLQSRRGSRRRQRAWVLFGLVVLPIGALCGWRLYQHLLPKYRHWKQDRALQQARDYIAQRDAEGAQLALEVALKAVPGNPETLRVAADMLEQVGAPQAMRLRRAVVQAAPDSAEDVARLIVCCLRFGDFNGAKDALSGASSAVSARTPMLQAALAYATATSETAVVAALLAELRQRFPNDVDLRHAQAVLHLLHPDERKREAARLELGALAREAPALTLAIERELAGDAVRSKDHAAARAHLARVARHPDAQFNDLLQIANLDLLIDHVPFERVAPPLAAAASAREADALAYVQWLLVQNRGREADVWLGTLAPSLQERPALRAARADAVAQIGDWDRLLPLIEAGAWGPVPREVSKLILAAHAVNDPNHLVLRRETWNLALAKAQSSLVSLRVLHRLAAAWSWSEERELTLVAIARAFPDQTWAHQALFNVYREKKRTADMRDVLRLLRDADPAVPRYQHDWALLSLLLEPSTVWTPAKETMRRLFEAEPGNATFVTGYAFALAQSERGAEALELVGRLGPADRDFPLRQPYLAFVFGVARRPEAVERAQQLGQGAGYLPEEESLFSRARIELMRKPARPAAPKAGKS